MRCSCIDWLAQHSTTLFLTCAIVAKLMRGENYYYRVQILFSERVLIFVSDSCRLAAETCMARLSLDDNDEHARDWFYQAEATG